jgi:hypothetical protein
MATQVALLFGLLAAFGLGLYIFRDGIGLVVFLLVGLAALVQLVRVIAGFGSSKSLKDLWSAFKDAFWGIG